jgi:hypothetical protein
LVGKGQLFAVAEQKLQAGFVDVDHVQPNYVDAYLLPQKLGHRHSTTAQVEHTRARVQGFGKVTSQPFCPVFVKNTHGFVSCNPQKTYQLSPHCVDLRKAFPPVRNGYRIYYTRSQPGPGIEAR